MRTILIVIIALITVGCGREAPQQGSGPEAAAPDGTAGISRVRYRDTVDAGQNGDDPLNPGCAEEYDRNFCPRVPNGTPYGDQCLSTKKLSEHYNQECHEPNDANHFKVHNCDDVCDTGHGTCETVAGHCGEASSAMCVCSPKPTTETPPPQ